VETTSGEFFSNYVTSVNFLSYSCPVQIRFESLHKTIRFAAPHHGKNSPANAGVGLHF